jgi:hypothetical protein
MKCQAFPFRLDTWKNGDAKTGQLNIAFITVREPVVYPVSRVSPDFHRTEQGWNPTGSMTAAGRTQGSFGTGDCFK